MFCLNLRSWLTHIWKHWVTSLIYRNYKSWKKWPLWYQKLWFTSSDEKYLKNVLRFIFSQTIILNMERKPDLKEKNTTDTILPLVIIFKWRYQMPWNFTKNFHHWDKHLSLFLFFPLPFLNCVYPSFFHTQFLELSHYRLAIFLFQAQLLNWQSLSLHF